MEGSPLITVVVPTYRRPDLLRRCLVSLVAQDVERTSYQVVVVDDGSGDSTPAVLEDLSSGWPQLEWAVQESNRGPAAARNLGVSMARAGLILFVDDDVVSPPDLLATHLRLHERADANLGVVGRVDWHPDLEVTAFMRWLDTTDLQFKFESMAEGPLDRPWEAFYTCNLSLAARTFEAAGGFDERFPYPAFEDTDLGVRLAQRGFRLEYRPEARAWHARAVTPEEFYRRMRMVGESAMLLHQAQPDLPFDLPLSGESAARGVRKLAIQALPLVARVAPLRPIRAMAYRARVNQAYREGIRAALARHPSDV